MALPELKDFNPSIGAQCRYSQCTDSEVAKSSFNGLTAIPFKGATGCKGATGKVTHSNKHGTGCSGNSSPDRKLVCTRICLMGGQYTEVSTLRRYDKPESKTAERNVDEKFRSFSKMDGSSAGYLYNSSPVCALHKTVVCTVNKAFSKCQKDGGKACAKENCDVKKEISCVAVLPSRDKNGKHLTHVTKQLGTDLSAYTNECKHTIDPCGSLPMLV